MFSISIIVIYQPSLNPSLCISPSWRAGDGLDSLCWGWMCFSSTSLTFWGSFQFHPEPIFLSHHLIHFHTAPGFFVVTSLLTTQDGCPRWVHTLPEYTEVDLTLPAHPHHLPLSSLCPVLQPLAHPWTLLPGIFTIPFLPSRKLSLLSRWKKSHSSFQMQLKMFSSLRNSLRPLMIFPLWTTKTLYVCYLLACVTFVCCDLPVCLLCRLCSGRSMRAGVEPSELRSCVVQWIGVWVLQLDFLDLHSNLPAP